MRNAAPWLRKQLHTAYGRRRLSDEEYRLVTRAARELQHRAAETAQAQPGREGGGAS